MARGLAFNDQLLAMWKATLLKAYKEIDPSDLEELKRYCGIMAKINEAYRNLDGKEIVLGKVNPLVTFISKMEGIADTMSRKLGLHQAYRFTALKAKNMAKTGKGGRGDDDEDDKEDDLNGPVNLP